MKGVEVANGYGRPEKMSQSQRNGKGTVISAEWEERALVRRGRRRPTAESWCALPGFDQDFGRCKSEDDG